MYGNASYGSKRRSYVKHHGMRRISCVVVAFFVIFILWLLSLFAMSKRWFVGGHSDIQVNSGRDVKEVRGVVVDKKSEKLFRIRETRAPKAKVAEISDPPGDGNYRTSLNGIQCPLYNPVSLDRIRLPLKKPSGKKSTSVARKFNRRVSSCLANGMWHRVRVKDLHEILRGIVRIGNVMRDSFVLDWGSGCGHNMQFLWKEFNVRSVGIDLAKAVVSYARKTTSNELLYCIADGTNISWIPSNTFDHVISFGSVHYVSNQTVFCHVLRQMIRVIKPSGTVYNGWSDEFDFKRAHVPLCLADLPVTYEIVEESQAFSHVKNFPPKKKKNVRNTYSLVVTKNPGMNNVSDDVYDKVEFVPVRCGGPKDVNCEATSHAVNAPNNVDKKSVIQKGVGKDESIAAREDNGKNDATRGAMAPLEHTESALSVDWPSCPPYDPAFEERQIPLSHLPRKKRTSVAQKYDRRAGNCNKDGIWHRVSIDDHRAILRIIAELIGVTKSSRLFDWGSGCGHHLQFMHDYFGAVGLGIDISNKTTEFARATMSKKNRFCVADGTKLEWLPSNFFDHAYSFGSIYHVYNKSLFCNVLRQMFRIVKVGGKVYNGWTMDAEFPRNEMEPCIASDMAPSCFRVEILEEGKLFRTVPYFPLKEKRRQPNTYSVLIHKLKCLG